MGLSISGHPVDDYASQVAHGLIPAGKYHRKACERHLRDRRREGTPGFPYVFVLEKAERFFRFAEKLKHYKGEWAGRPIVLTPFQKFRLGSVFGWRHKDTGFRRFTTSYNELPRKQGKSLEAAVVSIYVTFYEGEPGAEGYCLATKEKQATDVVFRDIKSLIQSSGLKSRLRVQVKNIHRDDTASKLEPLGSDSETLDGLNPHSITTDELHAFKHRGLLDVMESATGARRNPLHYQITTAGDDPVSVCGDQHDYACKILDGVLTDFGAETFFACIAHADPEDDWLSEETWKKANPHYGISVKSEDMMKLALKAKAMPSAAAEFKQKRLNLWVNTSAPSLSVDGWRQGQSQWEWDDLGDDPCWVGVDLSSKIDLCSVSAVFPPTPKRTKWRVVQRIWTPGDTLQERAHRDRAPYDVWEAQGWLMAPDGTSINQAAVQAELKALRGRFNVQVVGFDPWHADRLINQMKDEDGWTDEQVLEVPQTFAHMTSAEKRFKAEVLAANVDARGCPVTAWAVSNVVDQKDGKDNIMFSKKRSRGRIDPVKSATTALSLYLRQPVAKEPEYFVGVYGGRG
jgi:phage terminase large subunit-like protein